MWAVEGKKRGLPVLTLRGGVLEQSRQLGSQVLNRIRPISTTSKCEDKDESSSKSLYLTAGKVLTGQICISFTAQGFVPAQQIVYDKHDPIGHQGLWEGRGL